MSLSNVSVELDHRRLGQELDLFSVSDKVGPGLILWHPKGALVRENLEAFWRREHRVRGYQLVGSPHVGRSWLWETSGHLEHFSEGMYAPMQIDEQQYYAKPMNCPFHMEIFNSHRRSYRELPLRLAELGTVYRYERSGVLHGMLRARGFTQDDAHIFCTKEQLDAEVASVLELIRYFLSVFDFGAPKFYLSTRPDKAMGKEEDWTQAREALSDALRRAGVTYDIDEGGGAFYGPKLDVSVEDAHGRAWQLSTLQVDVNLPKRFELGYIGSDGRSHEPVVLHRALFGSLERFVGILIEHYEGAFPVWLAPVQARVVPVTERHEAYARDVIARARASELRWDLDARSEPLAARVRDAQLAKIPYLIVVGDRELGSQSVSLRKLGEGESRDVGLAEAIEEILSRDRQRT